MRVGITTDLRHSLFSAGHGNATFSLATVFKAMNAEVTFLHKQEGADWWDDVDGLKEDSPKRMFLGDALKQ